MAKAKRAVRKAPPADEDRRARFERIMTARMNRVLNTIRLLGNLASPNYDWNEQDIKLVHDAITDQLDTTIARFHKHKRGEKPTFTLKAATEPVG